MEAQETKGRTKRLKDNFATKLAYIGGGVGLGLFAVFGLLNASFIGGILGINIAGSLLGYPIPSSIIARAIIAFGMLTGVMVTGLVFIIAGSLTGWLAGAGIIAIKGLGTVKENEHNAEHK